MHVAEYFYGSYNNHNARRERKLLLNKKELEKLMRDVYKRQEYDRKQFAGRVRA